jgi:hypothetical protein
MKAARALLLACLALACTACQLPPGYVAQLGGNPAGPAPLAAEQTFR